MRSFFGVHKIVDRRDGRFRVLQHGTTIHGAERLRDDRGAIRSPSGRCRSPTSTRIRRRCRPSRRRAQRAGGPISVAIVGLGTGTLRLLRGAGRQLDLLRDRRRRSSSIARDPSRFTLLSTLRAGRADRARRCAPDARRAPDEYDLIVLDAFSSDAMPIHLMTREAMAIYLSQARAARHRR